MHSGADVEAFQAALNRDIGGDASTSQQSDSNTGIIFFSFFFWFSVLFCWNLASNLQDKENQIWFKKQ